MAGDSFHAETWSLLNQQVLESMLPKCYIFISNLRTIDRSKKKTEKDFPLPRWSEEAKSEFSGFCFQLGEGAAFSSPPFSPWRALLRRGLSPPPTVCDFTSETYNKTNVQPWRRNSAFLICTTLSCSYQGSLQLHHCYCTTNIAQLGSFH